MSGVVAYIRVSTTEQALGNHSLGTQEKKIRDYCNVRQHSLLEIFVDPGESARTTDRPQFQKMLTYCRRRREQVSAVVVADLSRLARNVGDLGSTIALLNQLRIRLESVDEQIADDSAVGVLTRNIIGTLNQFHSDSLSEKTRYRMKAAVKAGRYPRPSPVGYLNQDKRLVVDPERAPFVRQAFELMASGRFATGDAVLKLLTGLGLTTKRGARMSKQSFAHMLSNPIYTGWIVSGDDRVRGNHDPLVPGELFAQVQQRINGKSSPHKKLSEDFPLRGVVRCAKCGERLTAAWVKGRKEHYPRYWCWNSSCKGVAAGREELEGQFLKLLGDLQPSAKLLAELPQRAAAQWQERKNRIAESARSLSGRLADQTALNRKAIMAKLDGSLTEHEFDTVKEPIAEEIARIEAEIKALDSESSTLEELMRQTQAQAVDLVLTWNTSNVNQRHELALALFPEGLSFSRERLFFEPRNLTLNQMVWRFVEELGNVGVPNGI